MDEDTETQRSEVTGLYPPSWSAGEPRWHPRPPLKSALGATVLDVLDLDFEDLGTWHRDQYIISRNPHSDSAIIILIVSGKDT